MNRARAHRRVNQWRRYEDRYITADRGGFINNAMPIGGIKAVYRWERIKFTDDNVRHARIMRRS